MESTIFLKRNTNTLCGVLHCNTYGSKGILLFELPNYVRKDPLVSRRWSLVLKMGNIFPYNFLICCKHFDARYIFTPVARGKRLKSKLLNGAFPCRNLPISYKNNRNLIKRRQNIFKRCSTQTSWTTKPEISFAEDTSLIQGNDKKHRISKGVQTATKMVDKAIQVNMSTFSLIPIMDTDKKLCYMTGIPTFKILDTLIDSCNDIGQTEKCFMPLKERILMTMYKLKHNCSFEGLAMFFRTDEEIAKFYFEVTIKILAKATKCCIHWQTREQNNSIMPICFKSFQNVQTVLDCIQLKTESLRCLNCKNCTYSYYKVADTIKFLIGVSPSGLINYISKFVIVRSWDKPIFDLTDLSNKLEKGSTVMVDNEFILAKELTEAGVKMVQPEFSNSDVEFNSRIPSAQAYVESKITRIMKFKIFSDEKVSVSVIPFIDDIVSVLCGLSNISPPLLDDENSSDSDYNCDHSHSDYNDSSQSDYYGDDY